jgi:hypothetical protein
LEFLKDGWKINWSLKNALAYNPPEHPFSKCARERLEFFDRMRHLYLRGSFPEHISRKRKHPVEEEVDAAPLPTLPL